MSVEWSDWFSACLLLASLTPSATQSDQAVIVFNSQIMKKPNLVVDECKSEQPHYELSKGQLLGVRLVSDISPTADHLHWCGMLDEVGADILNPMMYISPVIVSRNHIRNSTKHELKVSLGRVGVSGYLTCLFYYNYTNSTSVENIRYYYTGCQTYIRLTDTPLNEPLIRFVSHLIHVTFQEFGDEVEEIRFNDNSTLRVDFAMADRENCTYTIIQRDGEFPLHIEDNKQDSTSTQEDCPYKRFLQGQNKTFHCDDTVHKKDGILFTKLYIYQDNSVISLEEKNKYTNASRETAIKLIYTDTAPNNQDNLIIRFNIETKVKSSLAISKCVSEVPHYVVYRRQNITVEILSDTLLVADVNKCGIGNLDKNSYHNFIEYDKRIQTKEKYGNIFKTKIFLSHIGVESGFFICHLIFNEVHIQRSDDTEEQNSLIDAITCMARITIADGRRDDYEVHYIPTVIEVSFKEFSNETEEIDFYESSSLNVDFDNISDQDDCVYTVKRIGYLGTEYSMNPAITKQSGIFFSKLTPYNDRNTISMEELNLQTQRTRHAAVKILYRGIYNYTASYKTYVSNSTSAACNRDAVLANAQDNRDAVLADAQDNHSDDYENIYDEVNEELLLLLHRPPQFVGCPPTR